MYSIYTWYIWLYISYFISLSNDINIILDIVKEYLLTLFKLFPYCDMSVTLLQNTFVEITNLIQVWNKFGYTYPYYIAFSFLQHFR